MHTQLQIIHLDVKPGNILIDRGRVVVADMGVSRTSNPSDDHKVGIPGAGTPAYVPPEAGWKDDINGDGFSEVDTKTFNTTTTSFKLKQPEFRFKEQYDIYTVGVSILELINGETPSRINRVAM